MGIVLINGARVDLSSIWGQLGGSGLLLWSAVPIWSPAGVSRVALGSMSGPCGASMGPLSERSGLDVGSARGFFVVDVGKIWARTGLAEQFWLRLHSICV